MVLGKWLLARLSGSSAQGANDTELFMEILEERDNRVYRSVFGSPYRNAIARVTPQLLADAVPSVDERWTNAGVYVFEPSSLRPVWTYVTAGLSTPWDVQERAALPRAPEEATSGVGVELVMQLPELNDWAIGLLNKLMLYQLAVADGLMKGERLDVAQRVPLLGIGCIPRDSNVQAIAVGFPMDVPKSFVLPSGRVRFLQLVGITRDEYAWSIPRGVESLIDALSTSHRLVTVLERPTLSIAVGSKLPDELARHFPRE